MNTADLHLEYAGFDPDFEVQKVVLSLVESLQGIAPSDSVMKLVFTKAKDAIEGRCRIASQAGTFSVDVASDSPVHAVEQIEGQMKAQIDNWKTTRF